MWCGSKGGDLLWSSGIVGRYDPSPKPGKNIPELLPLLSLFILNLVQGPLTLSEQIWTAATPPAETLKRVCIIFRITNNT